MKLENLLKDIAEVKIKGSQDLEIQGLVSHSQRVKPGALFFALKGSQSDGHQYLEEAIARGAVAVVISKEGAGADNASIIRARKVTIIESGSSTDLLPALAKKFYGDPSKRMKIIGITGTNGKTSTAYLIHNIFNQAGIRCGLLGTIEYLLGERKIPAQLTTPGLLDIYQYLGQMAAAGCRQAVMEISSHALHQGRTAGLDFSAAVFTNLGKDHLDYHQNNEDYLEAKSQLFKPLAADSWAVINTDDPYGLAILENTPGRIVGYGLRTIGPAGVNKSVFYLRTRGIKQAEEGTRFSVYAPGFKTGFIIDTPLLGVYNIYNILAAVGVALCHQVHPGYIREGVRSFAGIRGRLEAVQTGQPFKVFVDYAHTPDALENVLYTLRSLTRGKLILVFGCGGNRDKNKRSIMGRLASQLADYTIITSDNPRQEDPQEIVHEIEIGFVGRDYRTIIERKEAIWEALALARPEDTVLVAGKGHENYQILKDTVIPFNDKEVVQEGIRSLLKV